MANRTRVYGILGLVCAGVLVAPAAFADDPPPDAIWGDLGPITISEILIYETDTKLAPDNYIPINHTRIFKATATDKDCWRVNEEVEEGEGVWYPYDADVTTGTTKNDHHMWWTVSTGELSEAYGPKATYVAPDYSHRRWFYSDVSTANVHVFAVDYNIGAGERGKGDGDTGFPDETFGKASIALAVWQVTVDIQQFGTTSNAYQGPAIPSTHGGTTLGWLTPDNSIGAIGYRVNTQITGTIPEGRATEGFNWYQDKNGKVQYMRNGGIGSGWEDDQNTQGQWKEDFPTTYLFRDETPRNPNGTSPGGVRVIFAMDSPGAGTEPDNNNGIAPNDDEPDKGDWTDYRFDMKLMAYVKLKDVRVSNELIWQVKFDLIVYDGTWHIVDNSDSPKFGVVPPKR